jgi:hypothetical protein
MKDAIKHGPIIITAALIDVFNPHHDMAQLVFEADHFPEVSKGILREYMALAVNGQQIKFAELVESLLDIKRYDQPKQKKVLMVRGVDVMSFERHHLHYGYTNITILQGALYDTNSPVRDEKSREGKRFRLDYGVPWTVFTQICNEFEKRYQVHQSLRRLKAVPFKLRVLACLRQLRLGGPMSQHLVTYAMDYNMFRSFYGKFLNWMWLIKDDYIHLPKTDEEINHVERLYHRIGFPGAIGSVDCVHLPWNSCRHTLRMQCINAGAGDSKGKPPVVIPMCGFTQNKMLEHLRHVLGSNIRRYDCKIRQSN